MSDQSELSVIIPTLACAERAAYLRRALESVRAQSGVIVRPIVVANGAQCCDDVLAELEAQPDITCVRLMQQSLPAALEAGRARVETAFFTELDDDDILLPGCLSARLRILEAHPEVDVVIANGFISAGDRYAMSIPDIEAVRRNPLNALMTNNWLLPGAALFRSSVCPIELFADIPQYLEWTCIALRILHKHNFAFVEEPAVVHFNDHPFSINGSMECIVGRSAALEQLLRMDLSPTAKNHLKRRIAGHHHEVSCQWLNRGAMRKAWEAHWHSLIAPGGWRYTTYTRHLLSLLLRPRQAPGLGELR